MDNTEGHRPSFISEPLYLQSSLELPTRSHNFIAPSQMLQHVRRSMPEPSLSIYKTTPAFNIRISQLGDIIILLSLKLLSRKMAPNLPRVKGGRKRQQSRFSAPCPWCLEIDSYVRMRRYKWPPTGFVEFRVSFPFIDVVNVGRAFDPVRAFRERETCMCPVIPVQGLLRCA